MSKGKKQLEPITDQEFQSLMEENKQRIQKITQGESEIRPKLIISTRDKNNSKGEVLVAIHFSTGSKEEKEMALMAVGASICMKLQIPEAVMISAVAENQNGETALLLAGQTIDGRTAISMAPIKKDWQGHAEIGDFEETVYNKTLGGDMSLLPLVYAGFLRQFEIINAKQRLNERMSDEPSLN